MELNTDVLMNILEFCDLRALHICHQVSTLFNECSRKKRFFCLYYSFLSNSKSLKKKHFFRESCLSKDRILFMIQMYIQNNHNLDESKYMYYGKFFENIPSIIDSQKYFGFKQNMSQFFHDYQIPRPLQKKSS